MKYLVIEIQTNADETVGNLVWSFDTRNLAEQQYFLALSSAAVSELPTHAATLMTSEGRMIYTQCFKHPDKRQEETDG